MAAAHSDSKAFADWYESDYYLRPRTLRRAKVWTALAAAAVSLAVVAVTLLPAYRTAYQAGPLAPPHAAFNANCEACHSGGFVTATRFLPGNSGVRATPDEKCLACHSAGAHSPYQTRNSGPDDQAADCASCHREHHGIVPLTRISDDHCTSCHTRLETNDGKHRFAAAITSFADHPPLGAWRGPGGVKDPGTIKFNHKVHMELAGKLAGVSAERLGGMADELKRLGEQSCTFCHQPDADRRYMLPIRYANHCSGCHPLTSRPAGDWPAEVADEWAKTPLPHPVRDETAAKVRGALLERYFSLIARPQQPTTDAPVRPPVLSLADRDRARQLTGQTELRVFASDGGDAITELERPFFRLKGGCAYCHYETSQPDARPNGLPVYAYPRLRNRWPGSFPDGRFNPAGEHPSDAEQAARDRWYPYSQFNHDRHRYMDCQACHPAAVSTQTSDLLMPTIDDCRKCHNQSVGGARADCLECHVYHDRGRTPHGLRGRMTLEEALRITRPAGNRAP